jgi:hypothetical protein
MFWFQSLLVSKLVFSDVANLRRYVWARCTVADEVGSFKKLEVRGGLCKLQIQL